MASPAKPQPQESDPPFVPAMSDDYNPPLREKYSPVPPPAGDSVRFGPMPGTAGAAAGPPPPVPAGPGADAAAAEPPSAPPGPKVSSPWLEEDLPGGEKSRISFSSTTIQRRSKFLNRPPTPPKPRRPPGTVSPVSSSAAGLSGQPRVTFGPVVTAVADEQKEEVSESAKE
jgi:hypothetical protein